MALPLAGNISISLSPEGLPCATLTHPRGGSCQVVIAGACVTSWRTADGAERLSPMVRKDVSGGDCAGGISACGLQSLLPAEAWAIETMNGGDGDAPVVVSLFAESHPKGVLDETLAVVMPDSTAPLAARMTLALGANQLSVRIEVAHAGEEALGDMADVSAGKLGVDCSLRAHCSGQQAGGGELAPATSEDAAMEDAVEEEEGGMCNVALPDLERAGLRLRLEGFTKAAAAELPAVAAAAAPAAFAFDAMAPDRVVHLAPGETVAGALLLELST